MKPPSREYVETLIHEQGHPLRFPCVVALRDTSAGAAAWSEWVCALTEDGFDCALGTTDPGRAPMDRTGNITPNPKGVGRIPAGFYPDFLYPGWHGQGGTKRDHPAWRQCDGQFGTKAAPIIVERWDGERWVLFEDDPVVGPYNFHRALFRGAARRVGDFSHGCVVIRDRLEHWRLTLHIGYPEHGPTAAQQRSIRASLYILDVTPGGPA